MQKQYLKELMAELKEEIDKAKDNGLSDQDLLRETRNNYKKELKEKRRITYESKRI